MVTQFDEKGKIYTQVVSKHPVEVVIQTAQNKIRGSIHVRPDTRLKDELDHSDTFLAVTGAIICDDHDEELYRSNFLVVNVSHIVWVIPVEELVSQEN